MCQTWLGTTGCMERERQALLHFKHGLVDDHDLLSFWGDEQDKRLLPMERSPLWQAISFNDDLDSGNLEWLSHLSSLRLLDLSHVSLSKAIHWSQAINKLPSLIHLNLGDCSLPPLTTPSLSHVNSSAPLAFLDLSDNYDLASSVYPWVFNFSTTLVHLISISESNLNCLIPDAYGNMISLAYLDLRACALKGEIPEAYGNISSLTYLDMSENPLQGVIPDALGTCVPLNILISLRINCRVQYQYSWELGFS
ncbi:hypothetical protein CK203_096133 [Vitis vinifera]|uniref:Uncharacterized protein n=1 Tax=Vitis vinifera TaxID=29760 RepID=A0A438DVT5_VITVI|nr:hypothetical protein CK203_096133 [Vitis vinifera]